MRFLQHRHGLRAAGGGRQAGLDVVARGELRRAGAFASMIRARNDEEHGKRNGCRPVPTTTADARRGLDLARSAVTRHADPAVELAITFQDATGEEGLGTTRTVSPEEVRFATNRALGIGCRIGGTISFLPETDGVATDLSYVACVTEVAATPGSKPAFEVTARFERFAFIARRAPGSTRDPAR